MWCLLKMADSSLDDQECQLTANKPENIPQQCGVFTSLYARRLVTNSVIEVQQPRAQDSTWWLNFTREVYFPLPSKQALIMRLTVNKFYIGRALDCSTDENNIHVTRFKFLHRSGARRFNWPNRDDVACKHCSCVFLWPHYLDFLSKSTNWMKSNLFLETRLRKPFRLLLADDFWLLLTVHNPCVCTFFSFYFHVLSFVMFVVLFRHRAIINRH